MRVDRMSTGPTRHPLAVASADTCPDVSPDVFPVACGRAEKPGIAPAVRQPAPSVLPTFPCLLEVGA